MGCGSNSPRAGASTTAAVTASAPRDILSRSGDQMIARCLEFARHAQADGRPIVGILCEFTPRELILAAGAVPVCLCGGSHQMIGPAERDLPCNLCPLIKSTYGYHVTRSNPFLEMADLVIAESTCDGKKKMYELMSLSRRMYVLELPHHPDAERSADLWYDQLVDLQAHLEERFSVWITEKNLRDAIILMNRERRLRRDLAALMRRMPPPLTGRQLLEFKSIISAIPADLEEYHAAIAVLSQRPPDPALAGRVRVLLTGVPTVHGAERVVDLIEDVGGIIVAAENCTGLKPILDDIDESAADPLRAIADKYLHLPCSVMTPNARRQQSLRQLAAEYRPDCVIELIWQACLTYDVESALTRRLVENELHLPYLRIETDYSPADSARITTRVQALYETVRQRATARPSSPSPAPAASAAPDTSPPPPVCGGPLP